MRVYNQPFPTVHRHIRKMKTRDEIMESDRSLVEPIIENGDERAFRELYRKYTPRLFGFIYRILGRTDAEAEDVVQETWIRACENMDQFKWNSLFSTWLHGIGLHVARDHIRKKQRKRRLNPEQYYNTSGNKLFHEGVLDIETAVSRLPDGYRLVFVLHDIEGLKHHEIAEKLGITVGTSKSQLFNARKILRAKLTTSKEIHYER